MSLQVTHGIDIGHSRILRAQFDVWLFSVLVASILIVATAASIVAIMAAATKAISIVVLGDIL
tara:strand:- start:218 stop:406 length:189 start_codon:yes stop_codon:yes gene_type:complete